VTIDRGRWQAPPGVLRLLRAATVLVDAESVARGEYVPSRDCFMARAAVERLGARIVEEPRPPAPAAAEVTY
jgi:hypothetical protein